jgi:TolB-like protein/Tfp pilus assembly protein PilF
MDADHSIAILPFSDMSPQQDQQYFCEGLAEELINALRAVKNLRVVPRTSSFRFRNMDIGIPEIGKQLGVGHVIEGSVRKAGDKLRVALNLINTADESPEWSQRYDCNLADVLDVQDRIAAEIVARLKEGFPGETLGEPPDETAPAPRQERHINVAAYENYLKARYEWNKRTEEGLRRATELFSLAIAEDSNYAEAHAGLAETYVTLSLYGAVPPAEAIPKANTSVQAALTLNPDLPQALATQGCIHAIFEWQWDSAIALFKRAIDLDPDYAAARQWFAINCLAPIGRLAEAREQIETACILDPDSLAIQMTRGVLLYFEHNFEAAIAQYQKILEGNPDFGMAHFFLGQAYIELRRHREAIESLQRAVQLSGRSAETIALLGYAHSRAGNLGDAVHLSLELTRRSSQIYVSPVLQAQIRAGLDDLDRVFEYLEQAYHARSSDLIWIGIRPTMDPLRSDPRFQDLVKRIGVS